MEYSFPFASELYTFYFWRLLKKIMYDILKTITNSQLMLSRILIQDGDKIEKVITNVGSNIFRIVKNKRNVHDCTTANVMPCLTHEKIKKFSNLSSGYSDRSGCTSEVWVCCRKLPGIVRSNPDGGTDVALLWKSCVICRGLWMGLIFRPGKL